MTLESLPPALLATLAASACFFLPGWALVAPASSALPASFVRVLASAIVTTLVATGLAAAGRFSLPALLAANAVLSGAGFLARSLTANTAAAAAPALHDRIGPLVFAVALLAYWPAYPAFLGASDSTAYLATGISLAHHGGLYRDDELATTVPAELRPELFDSMSQVFASTGPPYRRMPGAMLLETLDADRAWPCFFPVPSVWAAIFVVAHAPGASTPEEAAPGFAPFFAALALWSFWLLARSWLGRYPGLVAVVLLGASGPFYNVARMPLSEPVAAFFSLGALAVLAGAGTPLRRSDAVLAGAALGAAVFTRIETALLIAMALALMPSLRRRSTAAGAATRSDDELPAAFHAAWASVSLLVVFEAALVPGTYISPLVDHLRNAWLTIVLQYGLPSFVVLAGGVALAAAGAVAVSRRIGIGAMLRWGFLFGVLAAHAIAASWLMERTPMWLSFAIGWPGLALAAIGALLAWKRGAELPMSALAVALAAAATLILFYNPHVFPILPWGARRFIPLLLPLFVLFACHACAQAATRSRLLSLVCYGLLAASVVAGGRPLWGKDLMDGAWEQLAYIAALIPPGGTLLVDRDISATMVEPALWLIHDRNSLPAPPADTRLGRSALPLLVSNYAPKGPVHFLTHGAGNQVRIPGIRMVLESRSMINLRFLEQAYDHRPEKTERYAMPLALYRLEPSTDARGEIVP